MKVSELIAEYLKTKAGKSQALYQGRLACFEEYLTAKDISLPAELSQKVLVNYQKHLKTKKLSVNTQYVYLESAKKFLLFLYEESYLFLNLGQALSLPKWERRQKIKISIKEAELMLSATKTECSEQDKAILSLYLIEDLSLADISRISVLDLDIFRMELRLRTKQKFILLQKESTRYLKTYLRKRTELKAKTDYLFVNKYGEQLSALLIGRIINILRPK
jgi:site-specific recombinase XerD